MATLLDIVTKDSTSRSVTIRIIDATAGTPETGVVFDSLGIDLWYRREGGLKVSITEADLTTPALDDAWESGGFLHIGDGEYRVDVPDAAFATGVEHVDIGGTVTGMVVIGGRVRLTDFDLEIAPGAAGGAASTEQVSNIGSGATGGTHVEATYDNTTRDTIDNAGADLKGGGLVGIPVTGHSFVVGREITIAGSIAYNGAFDIVSETANEVVITHSQDAEAFGGSETIVSSIKGEIFVGTITSGTFADTSAPQGDLHSMDDDNDVIKIVYGFNVGGSRQATDIGIFANVNGNTDEMVVKAYNFVTQQFEAKRTLPGSGGTTFIPLDPALISGNTGTGTEIGDVFIFLDTVTTTPSSLDVDLCLLTAVGTNVLIGYPNGYEVAAAGTSGTEFGVNGTSGNPCPYADALTMNAANALNQFAIHNGETVTLAADSDGISLTGQAWILQLADASIVNMHVRGATSVTGGSTGSGSEFHGCDMGTCTIAPCTIIASRFTSKASGGFTMQTAGTYIFHGCGSAVAGNDSPVFTFPGAGNTFISDRAGSGGRQYEGMSAGDLATVEGWGQFIEGTCSGGAVTIRGCLTTSGITNITLTDEARYDVSQVAGGVADEVLTKATHDVSQSLGKRIRQQTDFILAGDTAEVSNSPAANQIQLASSESSVDGTFDPGLIGIVGGTGAGQSRRILEYEGSTRLCTLNRDLKIPSDGTSEYVIVADPGGLHVNEGLAQAGGASTITLNALASTVNDTYVGQLVFLVSGPGQDQVGYVTGYVGATRVATIVTAMDGWATQPTVATGYIMVPMFSASTGILTGITSLPEWLRGLYRKDAMDATAKTELNLGGGAYDEATDSNEAQRDRGDAAWITAAGFNTTTPDAAGTAAALHATTDGLIGALNDPTATEIVDEWETQSQADPTGFHTNVLEINSSSPAAIRHALAAEQIIPFTVDTDTNAHTPTTTEFQADDITEAAADFFNDAIVIFTSGNLEGQRTSISDYALVGGIGQFTVVALTQAPANNDTGIII